MSLPMTREQRRDVSLALISLDGSFGDDVACTIVVHKIGSPWLNFTLTDGPPEEVVINFMIKEPDQ